MSNKNLKLKFTKLHPDAKIEKAYAGDAGFDLYCTKIDDNLEGFLTYHTGIAVEIPEGYFGLLCERSSCYKVRTTLVNSVGIIDSGYRGEIMAKFRIYKSAPIYDFYKVGDKFIQLVILELPKFELEQVDKLSDSERGKKGFGSSTKNKSK